MITVKYKGNEVYIIDAKMVSPGKRTNRVEYKRKLYFWPRIHAEEAKEYGKDKWAIRVSFYNAMYEQTKTKKILFEMWKLLKNPVRRISKN